MKKSFARPPGRREQKEKNFTTAVTLRHRPSGISVIVQDSRSQVQNRKLARERLLEVIEQAQQKRRPTEIAPREQARRRRSPRPTPLTPRIPQPTLTPRHLLHH